MNTNTYYLPIAEEITLELLLLGTGKFTVVQCGGTQ